MPDKIIFKKKILSFNKKISIPGDKSISIRWVLVSSMANGISKAKNLLKWNPKYTFDELIDEMIKEDLEKFRPKR